MSPRTPSQAPHPVPRSVYVRMVGMAVLWGASWPAGRVVAQALPATTAAAWRFLLAATVLVAWLVATRGWPRLSARQWGGLVLGGTVGVTAYALMFMLGLQRVEASRAAMVVTTNPVFTTVLAAWLFGERFNARIALGLVFAVVGAAIVLGRGDPTSLLSGGLGLGEVFLLGCLSCWTIYTLIAKALMKGVDALAATAISALIGAVQLVVVALVFDGPGTMLAAARALEVGSWAALIFLSLGSTVLAYAWYNHGVAVLGAGNAASWISLVPVLGVALSALTLGERIDGSLLAGGAVVVLGLVISNRGRNG